MDDLLFRISIPSSPNVLVTRYRAKGGAENLLYPRAALLLFTMHITSFRVEKKKKKGVSLKNEETVIYF